MFGGAGAECIGMGIAGACTGGYEGGWFELLMGGFFVEVGENRRNDLELGDEIDGDENGLSMKDENFEGGDIYQSENDRVTIGGVWALNEMNSAGQYFKLQ